MVTKSGKSALQLYKDDAFNAKAFGVLDKYCGIIVEGELDTHLFGDHFDYHST